MRCARSGILRDTSWTGKLWRGGVVIDVDFLSGMRREWFFNIHCVHMMIDVVGKEVGLLFR